jgi:glycosyltransferase involved in cell wall biosynthesis
LFEYMGSRKPVLGCIPDGGAKIYLEEYGASFITEPDNIEEIKNTLIKIFELYRKNELPVPKEEVVQKYRRDALTGELVKQMQSIVKRDIL